jgi:hypothetical protein
MCLSYRQNACHDDQLIAIVRSVIVETLYYVKLALITELIVKVIMKI